MININDFDNPKYLETFLIDYLHMKGIYSIYMSNLKRNHLQPYSFSDFVEDLYKHKNNIPSINPVLLRPPIHGSSAGILLRYSENSPHFGAV